MTPEETLAWHRANVGLSGRSSDPAVRDANAALLMPNDDRRVALATLDHWTDASGRVVVLSDCILYAMAWQRALGLDCPLLARPYAGHNDAGQIVPAAAGDGWVPAGDPRLCDAAGVGDIYRLESPVHFVCVAALEADTGALVLVAGGGGDGSLIHESRVLLVVPDGVPHLVDAERPYLPNGAPNGRRVTGRAVCP